MSLLHQINDSANNLLKEQVVMVENIEYIQQTLPEGSQPLTEAITDWLAALRQKLSRGGLKPNEKTSIASILGAIGALADNSGAASEAFDEINELGLANVLYKASAKKSPESSAAVTALHQAGKEPSARTYVDNALKALDNPQAINDLLGKLQTSIDQVMRVAISKQKGGSTSATGGAGVGGSPERSA